MIQGFPQKKTLSKQLLRHPTDMKTSYQLVLAAAFAVMAVASVQAQTTSGRSRDAVEAEAIATAHAPNQNVVRGSREALIVSACPLQAPRGDLAAWTMTRASLSTLDAQRSLRLGLGALLAFVLASGLWLGAILLRGYWHMQRLELQLEHYGRLFPGSLKQSFM